MIMAVSSRSTLEEILESLKKTDDKPKNSPPALPQRPTSRARLPSHLLARKSVEAIAGALPRPSQAAAAPTSDEQLISAVKVTPQENGNGLHSGERRDSRTEADSAYINEGEEVPNDDITSVLEATVASPAPEKAASKTSAQRAAVRKRWLEEGFKRNSRVWCRLTNKSDWVLGVVQSVEDGGKHVYDTSGQCFSASDVLPANPDILEGVDDLVQLSYLNEPAVLHNLKYRYKRDVIYTRAGPILIAVNPFKKIPVYSSDYIQLYRQRQKDPLKPHVYATADSAYKEMMADGVNQSIIISGESGAGKTETAKIAMQYLAVLGGGGGVENEILETNPILEAFGNAKTIRNNNSSRFGKLIDIFFDESGKISGAKIQTYLLEKSRVVQQSHSERSYHIFYQLCAGASTSLKERLKLKSASEYYYLNQGGCLRIDGVDDAKHFERTMNAMDVVQISKEDQEMAFEMLASVLWLGNVSFSTTDNEGHVVVNPSEAVQAAASLLKCDEDTLIRALCTRRIHARNEDIVQKLTLPQAIDARDALAKAIYASLFDWLVEKTNFALSVGKRRTGRCIGILDIYGFESFTKNSFEQLCINYANERLQQHFNRHLFKLEQEEYCTEGVDWTRVDFVDNQDCLDLIEKKPLGLISLIDEECTFPKATELSLAMKLNKHLSRNSCYKQERDAGFTVHHYAGEVTYDTSGIMEKNRDLLHVDLVDLLAQCNNSLARTFCVRSLDRKDSQKQSVFTKFKGQLFKLMQRLETTSPHFIRCVKPNTYQAPSVFDNELVLQQLRCCGVLEVVRITRSGYPTRYPHHHFSNRYGFLLQKPPPNADHLCVCISLLQQFNIPPEMYQVGITKLFFRAGQIAILEDTRSRTLHGIVCVQKLFKGYRERCRYRRLQAATLYWQSLFRGVRARFAFMKLRQRHRAAVVIQKYARRVQARSSYMKLKQRNAAALVIQNHLRGAIARRKYRNLQQEHAAAIAIQKHFRGHLARNHAAEALRRHKAAIIIQANVKTMRARKKFESVRAKLVLIQSVVRGWMARKSLEKKLQEVKQGAAVANQTSMESTTEKDVDLEKEALQSQLALWQSRAMAAEKLAEEKDAENASLMSKVQQYETKWSEYEAKMNSMEEVWQKQMASLQLSLAAAKKSLTTEEPIMLTAKSEDTVQNNFAGRSRASRHVLPRDEDTEWDESTSVGTKTPEQTMITAQQTFQQTSSDNSVAPAREADTSKSIVGRLVNEYEHRTQVFNDDADFLVEVKSGQVEAALSPDDELKKLKQRFEAWKKDFKLRLRETKVILQKLSHVDAGDKKKKWWSTKRGNP